MDQITAKASEVPAYAKACGIISLIIAIIAMIVPVVGVLFIAPIAILFGAVSLYGGYKGMGIATLIIIAIDLVISPTFWLNIAAGETQPGAVGNRMLTYFDVIGLIAMLYLAVRRK